MSQAKRQALANKQCRLTERLVEVLDDSGHSITTLDLLDALASLGFGLVEGTDDGGDSGVAFWSLAYFDRLKKAARK